VISEFTLATKHKEIIMEKTKFKSISILKQQEIIDATFQIALVISQKHECFKDKSEEDVAEWVAEQLRNLGFDTHPVGSSWGILK
jgi:hypothetical protein